MSERRELSNLVREAMRRCNWVVPPSVGFAVADAVLSAGYSQPESNDSGAN